MFLNGTLLLIIFGLVTHAVFLISIFAIYFESTVVRNVHPIENTNPSLASRVVFVVVDGLRVDALREKSSVYAMPFLREVITKKGTFAVSTSHLPTESRPSHIALLAGFYEDPSAVVKGWKENVVDFDSLFNRTCTFAFGNPDVINIFAKGVKNECLFKEMVPNDKVSFVKSEARALDLLVYKYIYQVLFEPQKSNLGKLRSKLKEGGVLFFIHLDEMDVSGHVDKPHTLEYTFSLMETDELVQKIVEMFEQFYKDNQTTYIVTSDHGMTYWGSHGAGSREETRTPFVAWGAGVNVPRAEIETQSYWEYLSLDGVEVKTIDQADVTPLISVLLGVSIPVNSIGKLPISFLDASLSFQTNAMELNAKQIEALYLAKRESVKRQSLSFVFRDFRDCYDSDTPTIYESERKITCYLEGLDYFHRYYQNILFICIVLSYLAWIFLLILRVTNTPCYLCYPLFNFLLLTALFLSGLFVSSQHLPDMFYLYFFLPQILWWMVLCHYRAIIQFFLDVVVLKDQILTCLLYLSGTEILVICFFERKYAILSIASLFSWRIVRVFRNDLFLFSVWGFSCVCLALLTLVPVTTHSINYIALLGSGLLLIVNNILILKSSFSEGIISIIRIILLIVALVNVIIELPFRHCLSWILLGLSFFLPLFGSNDQMKRWIHISLNLLCPYLLLALGHEVFFLQALILNLYCWLQIESLDDSKTPNGTIRHFRIAYAFMSYISISFFGVGNVASINSFNVVSTQSFIVSYSPFIIMILIMLKITIPFLVVTCALRVLSSTGHVSVVKVFVIVLVFCSLMGLQFLFCVNNVGSWFEIGSSISRYAIQQFCVLFLLIYFQVAKVLMK